MDQALRVMLNCLQCTNCERIPLDLQECANCMAILCKQCEAKIREIENPRDRRCPDPDCEDTSKPFAVQPFTSSMMIQQL